MINFIIRKWREFWLPGKNSLDVLLIVTIFILLFTGLCVMYSSSSITAWREFKDSEYFLKKQTIWICVGLVFFFFFSLFPYQKLEKLALIGIVLAIGLLILVFIPGIGKSVSTYYGRNFHRWIAIGPYQLQPSEVAKVAVLVYLASLFQKLKLEITLDYKKLLIPILLLLTVIVLILVEPAFGTTLEILFVILGFIFLFGFPFRNLLIAGIVSLPLIYILIDRVGYRKKRVEVWLDPYRYRFDEGHQLVTSFRAFLDGGWFGNKLASGYAHRYLTYSHTDFVLATFVEDFGFIGFMTFIFLVLLLLFRSFYLIQKIQDPFGFYLGAGILIVLGTQFIINMFVVTGIFPITGISLPFVSYGGSSILIVLISLGILVNITRKENLGL
ncbi:Cell division protein [Leptospira interrogans serovar Manilae]|uniref:Probable peptidoglycan glycosyltransferase FtsW n=1 Tax=Leptospira interrogans serovar Manilae TaxID=214675 RepID=A0AAQ1SNS3_LEPIR|nr:FtsW/RodA/SpoVE family cell cycle protein [Leptospira interrogans]AKP26117.1 cell division protein [Leptospira interrogans serovar Manilae]AKP29903.1 cell division protein [Leptospira interrogans serovar Manilae]EYU62893.1 cell division protein [Leptospira interrogans serovar Manilae]SOR61808.1 Cell division protein [Leptospira interrogans serovar Manilae]